MYEDDKPTYNLHKLKIQSPITAEQLKATRSHLTPSVVKKYNFQSMIHNQVQALS